MYANGEGVVQDYAEAAKWYRKAAEQGYAQAQSALGFMYNTGQGVQQDFAEAVKWFRNAAEQGDAFGQSNLGFMYWLGRGRGPELCARAYVAQLGVRAQPIRLFRLWEHGRHHLRADEIERGHARRTGQEDDRRPNRRGAAARSGVEASEVACPVTTSTFCPQAVQSSGMCRKVSVAASS